MASPLRTARLLLEPLGPEHAPALWPLLSPPEVWAHIGSPDATSEVQLAERFARVARGPGRPGERWVNFALRLQDASRPGPYVGRVEATVHDHGAYAEVAYLLGPTFWGQGLAVEATAALRDHLVQGGVRELWATTHPANDRSRRLLERLGFVASPSGVRELGSEDPGDLIYVWRAGEQRVVAPR